MCSQILDGFLRSMWADASPDELDKVVVVSSFTATLDLVQHLAEIRRWKHLRLDGAVPADARQSRVDSFNRACDDRRLFLLSTKAGGVGINL